MTHLSSLAVETTSLDGILKVQPPTVFEDFRGKYVETYNKRLYMENGVNIDFIQDDISVSRKSASKSSGLHGYLVGHFFSIRKCHLV